MHYLYPRHVMLSRVSAVCLCCLFSHTPYRPIETAARIELVFGIGLHYTAFSGNWLLYIQISVFACGALPELWTLKIWPGQIHDCRVRQTISDSCWSDVVNNTWRRWSTYNPSAVNSRLKIVVTCWSHSASSCSVYCATGDCMAWHSASRGSVCVSWDVFKLVLV